jgi:hypothetical protein
MIWCGLLRPGNESSHRDPQTEERLVHYLIAETYDEHLPVHGCEAVPNLYSRELSRIRHVHWAIFRV